MLQKVNQTKNCRQISVIKMNYFFIPTVAVKSKELTVLSTIVSQFNSFKIVAEKKYV